MYDGGPLVPVCQNSVDPPMSDEINPSYLGKLRSALARVAQRDRPFLPSFARELGAHGGKGRVEMRNDKMERLTDRERELLDLFRAMAERDRRMLLSLAAKLVAKPGAGNTGS